LATKIYDQAMKAHSKCCSIHAPSLTDELLSMAEREHLNQFGLAGQVWCGS